MTQWQVVRIKDIEEDQKFIAVPYELNATHIG